MKHGFYTKLAFTNIWKNRRTYVPYILTCILTVMMYYMVKSLSVNPGLRDMYGGSSVAVTLNLGTYVIALFAFIFLFYTNSFLMKRRKKEFGMFNILGMEKEHLARMILTETILVTVLSIGLGLGLGILFDKVMFLLMCKIVGAKISLGFFVSGSVILSAVRLFCVIYLIIYLKAVYTVQISRPVELLRGSSTGEREPKTKGLMALLGMILLGTGYGLAITIKNPIASIGVFFVAVILVIVGTYLLFTAGSIVILKALRRNRRFYYQPRHFISVSGMLYRMKQNAVGLANICILSTMVLVMLSSTTALMFGMEDMLKIRYPNDFAVHSREPDTSGQNDKIFQKIEEFCEAESIPVENKVRYASLVFVAEEKGDWFETNGKEINVNGNTSGLRALFFIPLSDYNTASEEKKMLAGNEALIFSDYEAYEKPELGIFDREYQITGHLEEFFGNGASDTNIVTSYYIVVTDEEFGKLKEIGEKELGEMGTVQTYYGFDTSASGKKQELLERQILDIIVEVGAEYEGNYNGFMESRIGNRRDFMGIYGGLFFLGLFLGTLFIMATVLIIYYKQISEGYEDRERFEIMQKVGMTQDEVKGTIRSQVLTVFFLPIAVAGIHIMAAFPLIRLLLAVIGMVNVKLYLICTLVAFLVFAILYVIIYSLTARTYYKIVRR